MRAHLAIAACLAVAAGIHADPPFPGVGERSESSLLPAQSVPRAVERGQASPPPVLEQIIARREMRRHEQRIEKSDLKDGIVTLTYSDGTVLSEPVKHVVQPLRVKGAVDVSLALRRLERAAYAAAQIDAASPPEARIAVLDTLAAQAGRGSLAQALAAAAVGALAGIAAGKLKTPRKDPRP